MLNQKREKDRIEGDKIFLDSNGKFPKKIIIRDHNSRRIQNYRFLKTKSGKFQLVK
jgi:hypothetical protein